MASLRDQALGAIRKKIMSRELGIGVRTSERALMEQHLEGLTRTPVREALAILTERGIIDQHPQVGFSVRSVDIDEARKVLRLHRRVEVPIVEELAETKTGAWTATVSDALDDLKRAAGESHDDLALDAVHKLHCELARLGGFSVGVDAVAGFRDRLQLFYLRTTPLGEAELEAVSREHVRLVNELENGHSKEALEALHDHFDAEEGRVEARRDEGSDTPTSSRSSPKEAMSSG